MLVQGMEVVGVCGFSYQPIELQEEMNLVYGHQKNGGFGNYQQPIEVGEKRNLVYGNQKKSAMAISHSFAAGFEEQKRELDRFIAVETERFISAIEEERKQQLVSLIRRLESKAVTLLTQKEEEILRATQQNLALEEYLRRTETENQTWQRLARENEAVVWALNNALEQVKQSVVCSSASSSSSSNAAEDAASSCDVSLQSHRKKRRGEEEEETHEKMVCKACNSAYSRVLLLPCRHLCCCRSCEAFLDFCPVCKSVKKASIEVYMN